MNSYNTKSESDYTITMPGSGLSMAPFITRDVDLEIRKKNTNLSIGDIVVFWYKGRIVAHRIIFTRKHGHAREYLLKGDGNYDVDGYFQKRDILGKVMSIAYTSTLISLRSPIQRFLAHWYAAKSLCQSLFKGKYT